MKPAIGMATIDSVVATAAGMNRRDGLTAASAYQVAGVVPAGAPAPSDCRSTGIVSDPWPRRPWPRAQAVGALGHDPVAGLQALVDRHHAVVDGAQLTCRTATVSSSWTRKTKAPAEPAAPPRWESRWRPARGHVQAGIDELVRKQRVVGIVEARLELERAGGDVDLVVQRFQLAGGDAAGIGPVIGLHGQRVAGRQLGPHFGQLGLGQREHHGDGLGLGDDHQAIGVGTGHQVALVHGAGRDGH